jgi:ketosteroid isomerase-like protein
VSTGTAEERRLLEAANGAFYTAVETADLDLLGAVWLDGPDAGGVVCVHPGWPAVRGRSEVLRSFALIMANMPYIQFFLTDVDIRVSGDVAVVGCVENTLTALEGEEDPAAGFAGGRVVATNIFRRFESGWRLWVHHGSPVLALDPDDSEDDADDDSLYDFPDPEDPQGSP